MTEQIHSRAASVMERAWKSTPEDCAGLLDSSIFVLAPVFAGIATFVCDGEKPRFIYHGDDYYVMYENRSNRYRKLCIKSFPEGEVREEVEVSWRAREFRPPRGKVRRVLKHPDGSVERSKNTLEDISATQEFVSRFAQRVSQV